MARITAQETVNFLESTADAAQHVRHRKCLGVREGGSGKGIWESADRDIIAFLPPFSFLIYSTYTEVYVYRSRSIYQPGI